MLLRSIPLSTMALRQLPPPIFISHVANGFKFIFEDLLTNFFGVVEALLSPYKEALIAPLVLVSMHVFGFFDFQVLPSVV
jgi:hypothetical protein